MVSTEIGVPTNLDYGSPSDPQCGIFLSFGGSQGHELVLDNGR